jgi:radical SAM-linked protein
VTAAAGFRYRITFAKTEAMRFTGHLDLHRAWERTFRRAGLPLAYTQGFSPHPRLQLAAALPLGVLGEAELMDAWMEQMLPPADVLERLRRAAPPGIGILDVQVVEPREPSLQLRVQAATFDATSGDETAYADLKARVAGLVARPSIERARRGKPYDLRPLIHELGAEAGSPPHLRMTLAAREGATGRPEEVLAELGLDPAAARITRCKLLLGPPPA